MTTNYERIVEALRAGPMGGDELASRTGLTRRSVGQILGAMNRRGELVQLEGDTWSLIVHAQTTELDTADALQVVDAAPAIDASFAVWNDGSVCIDKAGVQVALTAAEVRAMWDHLARFMR